MIRTTSTPSKLEQQKALLGGAVPVKAPKPKSKAQAKPENSVTALKIVDSQTSLFDYNDIPVPTAIRAREAAERIKLRLRRSAEDIIEIGRDLIAVKDSLPHGSFLPWIEAEFGMAERTARRFMDVARVYAGKSATVADLDPTALYELAAPKTPLEVREEVEKMIEAGEVVTKAKIEELRREKERLEKAKALAEEEIEEKDAKVSELETALNTAVSVEVDKVAKKIAKGYEDEIVRLKAEIAELKKPRPGITIDNETGNVVAFGKHLSDEEAAAIDAETDDYADADFNAVASDHDKAVAFFGCVRSIANMKASVEAVYTHITEGRSKELVAEYMAMVDLAFSQIKAVKDRHNG